MKNKFAIKVQEMWLWVYFIWAAALLLNEMLFMPTTKGWLTAYGIEAFMFAWFLIGAIGTYTDMVKEDMYGGGGMMW